MLFYFLICFIFVFIILFFILLQTLLKSVISMAQEEIPMVRNDETDEPEPRSILLLGQTGI